MFPLNLLAQVLDPAPPATQPVTPTLPTDDGSYGLSMVLAFLLTAVILFVVCSPIRRD